MNVWAEQLRCWGLHRDDAGWSVHVDKTLPVDLRTLGEHRGDRGKFRLRAGPFLIAVGVECLSGGCYRLSVGEEQLVIGGNRAHGCFFLYDESVIKSDVEIPSTADDLEGLDGGHGHYRACFELCW